MGGEKEISSELKQLETRTGHRDTANLVPKR
jgi:hypothetical protein